MGTTYAGVLSYLSFLLAITRNWLEGACWSISPRQEWIALVSLAAVGYFVGTAAECLFGGDNTWIEFAEATLTEADCNTNNS